ncbi:hypothetical protein KIW84_051567 [Lathyrus oleraceus]|uniref:ZF-HD dimerization-type domain-containing protein n=1 Tax=Pisum sativum TaxID=3888 RepID=A0A9D4WPS0_PEA|nr:hypothetical protein KIW84_051567 [Pisum sativum]
MEFDEHEEDQEEEEEEEEEMGFPVTPVAGYDSLGNSGVRSKMSGGTMETDGAAVIPTGGVLKNGPKGTVRYRECQKNHAVSIGGHAVDGCCEFLAAGEEGTLEAVICAACNCHRNFHRKEIDGEVISHNHQPRSHSQTQYHHHQLSPYYHRAALPPPPGYHQLLTPPPVSHHRPLALPPVASSGGFSREDDDVSIPSSSGGGGSGTKKRFRTKFTQEQKDKMLAFAEGIGWRIQKEDEAAIEQFCAENYIKRNVLKVWMHNNKHTLDEYGSEVWR